MTVLRSKFRTLTDLPHALHEIVDLIPTRSYLPIIIVLAALVGATTYWIRWDERAEEHSSIQEITNLSNTLAEHVGRTLRQADQLASVFQLEAKKGRARELVESLAAAGAIGNEVFLQVAIADRLGNVVVSSIKNAPGINLDDREHFRVHKTSDARLLFISKPVIGRISRQWSIQLSKRLETESGEFNGVVVVSMNPEYFTNLYKAIDVGDRGVVGVIDLESNVFLARHSRFDTEPGKALPETARLYTELRKTYRGNFEATSPIDGQERHYAYRMVEGFPLVVVVGVDDQDMMAAANVRKSVFLTVVAILALVIIAYELLRIRSMTRLERAAKSEQLARRLQETEKDHLQKLFDTMPDGVLVVDGHGKIARANDNTYRLLGAPEGTLVGISIAEFGNKLYLPSSAIDIQWKEQFTTKLSELLLGKTAQFSIAMRGEKSKVLQFRTSSMGGLSKDTVFVVRDITLESQLDRMKSEFVSTAAHQLKTPLATIYGFSELLAADKVPDASRAQVYASIHSQAKQLSALLSDLLDLARIEARASNTADQRDSSISYLLKKAREFDPKIEKRIDIIPCNSDVVVHGDEKLIIQAIYNVLDNAAKYSAPDSLISVATRIAVDGTSVSISVSDPGIGMTAQQLEQAFQRFFRANPDSTVPGTGLGLSFVKEVVEMHDGSISIASHIGFGTCVTMRFPVRRLPRS